MPILGFPAGTDWHQPFTAHDEDDVAINLTGATALTLVIYHGFNTVDFTLTVGAGLVVVSATAGSLRFDLTNVQTQSMAGDYLYECYGTLASGDRVILDRGELHISPSFVGI